MRDCKAAGPFLLTPFLLTPFLLFVDGQPTPPLQARGVVSGQLQFVLDGLVDSSKLELLTSAICQLPPQHPTLSICEVHGQTKALVRTG